MPKPTGSHRGGIQKTSLSLPTGLWARVRVRAIEEGRPAQALLIEALESILKAPKRQKAR